MIFLGIETSCDETAAAVVEETGDPQRPWRVRSNVVASQAAVHREWGGVVPELSARQHIRDICGVVEQAIADAGAPTLRRHCGDAGARSRRLAARGPVLRQVAGVGAIGAARPRASPGGTYRVARRWRTARCRCRRSCSSCRAGTRASTGSRSPARYETLGRTRDDAAGEAFDKVAKLLGLGYPGGPAIDLIARHGNDRAVPFPKTRLTHADRNAPHLPGRRDFSFSGLKTAVAPARDDAPRRARPCGRRPAAAVGDRRYRGELPARGRRNAARSTLRSGPMVRRTQRRHCRRRVGQQPSA